jgi:hypothetical protein
LYYGLLEVLLGRLLYSYLHTPAVGEVDEVMAAARCRSLFMMEKVMMGLTLCEQVSLGFMILHLFSCYFKLLFVGDFSAIS